MRTCTHDHAHLTVYVVNMIQKMCVVLLVMCDYVGGGDCMVDDGWGVWDVKCVVEFDEIADFMPVDLTLLTHTHLSYLFSHSPCLIHPSRACGKAVDGSAECLDALRASGRCW